MQELDLARPPRHGSTRRSCERRIRAHRIFGVALVPVLLLAPGCDRSATEPDHGEPAHLELRLRATGDLLATVVRADGTWDGTLPTLQVDQEIAVDLVFRDDDGNLIPLGGEFTANARLADGAPEGIVELEPHGDHVDIEGVAPGTTQIRFQLSHGGHSDWDAPVIGITVTAP